MFSASIGRDGRRRWSGLLVVDAFVVVLAALDLGVGVLHEIQHGKPAAGAALTGLFGGTSATVYFGALCLCWDEGPSPRRILLALASCIALVGTTLLGAQQCMDAPSEHLSRVLFLGHTGSLPVARTHVTGEHPLCNVWWSAGVVASCSFLAFAALRLCGGRAFELAGPAGSGTAAPALPGAADGLVPQRPSHPIMRQQVEAEISRIYQQAAPGKVQQAAHLIRRYPPEQWHQMLRMIGYKYLLRDTTTFIVLGVITTTDKLVVGMVRLSTRQYWQTQRPCAPHMHAGRKRVCWKPRHNSSLLITGSGGRLRFCSRSAPSCCLTDSWTPRTASSTTAFELSHFSQAHTTVRPGSCCQSTPSHSCAHSIRSCFRHQRQSLARQKNGLRCRGLKRGCGVQAAGTGKRMSATLSCTRLIFVC